MNLRPFSAVALTCAIGGAVIVPAHRSLANDHMFPSSPAAKSSIDYDSRGFLIHGKRTFLVSAGLEYARIPHELWRDRLLRLKRGGYNCVEVYCFWNWHEAEEGKFNFSGDHDLGAFLQLVHSLGMYAICRVGPYYCAEWDHGGYPIWLKFKPGLLAREDDPQFEKYVDRFFEHLIPVVAANQVSHGGSVVMVQLENEHPAGWGTEMPNGYFRHLQAKAVELGIDVPYFFSGLHHGGDPAGNSPNFDDTNRPNPWFTTEFWSVWYDHYGPQPGDAREFGRRSWKIIAHGGNGYNHYMAHGGSNFAYTNNNEDAASYDYGAAVGQAGDLRPVYYEFKKAALFAESFPDILENSLDAGTSFSGISSSSAVHVTARRSPAGTIAFLDNSGRTAADTTISAPAGIDAAPVNLTLGPGEIVPVVSGYTIGEGVSIDWAPARTLGVFKQGNTTTLAVYGPVGSQIGLKLSVPNTAKVIGQSAELTVANSSAVVKTAVASGTPTQFGFSVGQQTYRILVMNTDDANRTWVIDTGDSPYLVVGPNYVGDAELQDGQLAVHIETGWNQTPSSNSLAYGETFEPKSLTGTGQARSTATALSLSPWQTAEATRSARPNTDDSKWFAAADPVQMGADGDNTADAWYRASATVPNAGNYTLHFASVRDRAQVFVDGVAQRAQLGRPNDNILHLTKGTHQLAVFTAHDGRDKIFGVTGSIAMIDPKGLVGPASLVVKSGDDVALTSWSVLHLPGDPGAAAAPPKSDTAGWQTYTLGTDAFGHASGWAWFQTVVPAGTAKGVSTSLSFDSVDDNVTVFVNGQKLMHHEGWNQSFVVPTGTAWSKTGSNSIQLLVENQNGTGGVNKNVTVGSFEANLPIVGWKLHGGVDNTNTAASWSTLAPQALFDGPAPVTVPTWYRSTFNAPPVSGSNTIYRVVTTGLGHGSVWVNGHNLGRYPEKIPINGLYIPECWMVSGANTVVIYEEDGVRPDRVTVQAEVAASRDLAVLTATK